MDHKPTNNFPKGQRRTKSIITDNFTDKRGSFNTLLNIDHKSIGAHKMSKGLSVQCITLVDHFERHRLALVFAIQKVRHYFLAHPLNLVTHSNPFEYLLSISVMSGRTARWLFQLNEFDITMITSRGLWSQALSDLLA